MRRIIVWMMGLGCILLAAQWGIGQTGSTPCGHDASPSDCSDCETWDEYMEECVPIPIIWTTNVVQCPLLKVRSCNTSLCVCTQAGVTSRLAVAAPGYEVVREGKREVQPDPPSCAEKIVGSFTLIDVQWNWTVHGVEAMPQSGSGDTAEFEYRVPDEPYSIMIEFEAIGLSEEPECGQVSDKGFGPTVVGHVYKLIEIDECECPPTEYVRVLVREGKVLGGVTLWDPHCMPVLYCEPICPDSCTPQWRIEGWAPNLVRQIQVATRLPVTGTNCLEYRTGSERLREPEAIDRDVAHELKHCKIISQFVNDFNEKIRHSPVFTSLDECTETIKAMQEEWVKGIKDLQERNETHCPDFAGEQKYYVTPCGEEKPFVPPRFYCQ